MTTRLFKRKARVRVDTLVLENLDVAFDVTRSLKPEPNTAELKIWNLAEERRSQIESLASVPVIIEAGYESGTSVIFHGDLRNAKTTREGPDLITSIESGDGEHAHRRARVNRSFSSGTPLSSVLDHLVRAMGVGVGNAAEAIRAAELEGAGRLFREGVVLSGGAAVELDTLLRSCGLEYSIQDGALQVLTRGRPLAGTAVLLSPDTGLIESPTKELDEQRRPFVSAKCLMIPDIVPGRLVRLQSAGISGQFRVEKAKYSGDTAATDWGIELDLRGAEASTAARRAA